MKQIKINQASTLFLRAAAAIMGLSVLALCVVVLPAVSKNWEEAEPELAYLKYPILIGLSLSAIVFFAALYQGVKLLGYIDKNKVFSKASVKALNNIKYCGFIIGGLYAIALPLIHHLAQQLDAPGVGVIGLIFTFAPLVIAVFAGVFARLLQNAIDIKSEDDLTV